MTPFFAKMLLFKKFEAGEISMECAEYFDTIISENTLKTTQKKCNTTLRGVNDFKRLNMTYIEDAHMVTDMADILANIFEETYTNDLKRFVAVSPSVGDKLLHFTEYIETISCLDHGKRVYLPMLLGQSTNYETLPVTGDEQGLMFGDSDIEFTKIHLEKIKAYFIAQGNSEALLKLGNVEKAINKAYDEYKNRPKKSV